MGKARGFVLVGALVMVLVLGVLVTTATFSGYSNRINTSDALNAYQAQLAAEAGLDYGLYKVWHERWENEQDRTYAKYLPKINAYLPIGPNNPHPKQTEKGTLDEQNKIRYEVVIERRDVIDNTSGDNVITFNLTSTGLLADDYTARKLQQTIQIREPQRGFDFALLTNNANCIFCHTRVRPMEALGGDASFPYRRLKIGVLESLEVRYTPSDPLATRHDAKSYVAGTVYTRGELSISKFANDTASAPSGRETVQSGNTPEMRFKTLQERGKFDITDQTTKSFTAVSCEGGTCDPGENFYFKYPDQTTVKDKLKWVWPDEELPDKFPLPVADENNNRIVEDTEWDKAVNDSKAGRDRNNPPGQVTGLGITKVSSILTDWPTSGGSILSSGDKANVVLDGQSNPLTISGTVYVDGDVILRGRIQGKGKLIVRGNAYVMGDMVYWCTITNGECNEAQYAEGARNPRSETLPRFALSAVGNIIIGDYLTPRYNDASNDAVVDLGCPSSNPTSAVRAACGNSSFTMLELTVFNEKELVRAINEPTHKPRFYTLVEGQPIYFNAYDGLGNYNAEGQDSYWPYNYLNGSRAAGDVLRISRNGQPYNLSGSQANEIFNRSVRVSLAPKNNWVSGPTLKRMWNNSIERSSNRPGEGRPLNGEYRFDGLLYSANGIFSIIRNRLNPTTVSKTNGSWDLRGAMVAADTGVLTPGDANRDNVDGLNPNRSAALEVYYDQRMANFFSVRDLNELRPYRSDWKVVAR